MNRSFPTHSGKRYVSLNWDVFQSRMALSLHDSNCNIEEAVQDALRTACGGVDEDGKPIEFTVRIQANHIS